MAIIMKLYLDKIKHSLLLVLNSYFLKVVKYPEKSIGLSIFGYCKPSFPQKEDK